MIVICSQDQINHKQFHILFHIWLDVWVRWLVFGFNQMHFQDVVEFKPWEHWKCDWLKYQLTKHTQTSLRIKRETMNEECIICHIVGFS